MARPEVPQSLSTDLFQLYRDVQQVEGYLSTARSEEWNDADSENCSFKGILDKAFSYSANKTATDKVRELSGRVRAFNQEKLRDFTELRMVSPLPAEFGEERIMQAENNEWQPLNFFLGNTGSSLTTLQAIDAVDNDVANLRRAIQQAHLQLFPQMTPPGQTTFDWICSAISAVAIIVVFLAALAVQVNESKNH